MNNEVFDVITVFDKPVLFTNARIDRSEVPEDLYCYDIRHDDYEGNLAELKDFVFVNHGGTILSKEPFKARIYEGELCDTELGIPMTEDDYNFLSESCTIDEYRERYNEFVSEYCDSNEEDEDMEI